MNLDRLLPEPRYGASRWKDWYLQKIRTAFLALFLPVMACATTGKHDNQDHASPSETVACAQLSGVVVLANAISIPTSGAVVSSATVVGATGAGPKAIPEYCLLNGAIHPIDPRAPDIDFEIALPTSWNHKVMMFGGGGYDGAIPPLIGNVPAGPVDGLTPIQRGYAVFGSDSGHRAGALKSADGAFGLNDEAVSNFSGDALKKTHDVAIYLIRKHYAQPIARAYFAGGSSGGREALEVTQRWPKDWDGAIVLYPAWNAASLDLQFGRIARSMSKPGAYLNPIKRILLFDAAVKACDQLDGVADGIVSNVERCNQIFDPKTALGADGRSLRCSSGTDEGDACLSDAQIEALEVYASPIKFSYPLGSGETEYPGFNIYGSDLGMPNVAVVQPIVTMLALNQLAPASPMPTTAPYSSIFWDQWIRYFVARDEKANSLGVDPEHPGPFQARISVLAALQDINKSDLSAFAARGGKILMAHGTADVLVSTRASEIYYQRLQSTMGTSKVRLFVRYYEIAGYGHAFSSRFNAAWDSLSVLENWVEKAIEPPPQTVTDTVGVSGRTRPLCEWPSFPRYKGDGDVNKASSFSCVRS